MACRIRRYEVAITGNVEGARFVHGREQTLRRHLKTIMPELIVQNHPLSAFYLQSAERG